ncbi:MAG: hypothetical protein HY336_00950 [Candidatus Doudnabacteria bacterium]|nr:hypothetical protein [Candidatus Doudnabacteria bacterium]
MQELTEEQRARLAQQEQAREQAGEVLSEKEKTAPGFRAPDVKPEIPSEVVNFPDIKERLNQPAKKAEAEKLTDRAVRNKANLFLQQGRSLDEVMAQLGDDYSNAVDFLGSNVEGDETEEQKKSA